MVIEHMYTDSKRILDPYIIVPQYIVVHSTGSAIGSCERLYNSHNRIGQNSEHGIVDAEKCWQTLPFNYKGGHVGDKGNYISIGFEICEPTNIKYKDSAHTVIDTTKYNPLNTSVQADALKRWNNAIEMCAYMCKETGLPVSAVKSHKEMAKLGLATNHADTAHWFSIFGKTMDDFREEVKAKLVTPTTKKYYIVRACTNANKEYAEINLAKIKSIGFAGAYIEEVER